MGTSLGFSIPTTARVVAGMFVQAQSRCFPSTLKWHFIVRLMHSGGSLPHALSFIFHVPLFKEQRGFTLRQFQTKVLSTHKEVVDHRTYPHEHSSMIFILKKRVLVLCFRRDIRLCSQKQHPCSPHQSHKVVVGMREWSGSCRRHTPIQTPSHMETSKLSCFSHPP
jgi:hypothetical protein